MATTKKHHFPLTVRWGDIDAFGHINNATYLTYIQEARVDFTWYSRKRRNEQPLLLDMVVARIEVDYLLPIYEGHTNLDIAVWVERIGTSSFTFAYEVSEGATLYARAKSIQVAVSMESKTSRPLNNVEREFLNEYLAEKQ